MKKNFLTKVSVAVLAFFIGISSVCLAYAANSDEKVVRIGYIDYENFIAADKEGNYIGFGAELLKNIANYTGWKYEFVYDSFANHLENLKTGKIDFFCHAQKTPEREETYLFSKYSTGAESNVLYVKKDDNRFYYADYESLNGISIAFLNGSFQNEEFADYAKTHGFSYQPRMFTSQTGAFAALDNGKVDAVAMGSLGSVDGYKVIDIFGFDPFYFMTGKGNAALLQKLDESLTQILAFNPVYMMELHKKYYSSKLAINGLLFTHSEADYIAQSPFVTVGLLPNRSPLAAKNSNGKAAGILVDLLELISKKSGLKFNYQFLKEGQTGADYLTKNGGGLVAGVALSAFSLPNPNLLQSESLFDNSVVFVGRSGMEFSPTASLTVALPIAFTSGKNAISALYPQFQYQECSSNAECLKAIRDGKADIMLQNTYVMRELLQSPLYDSLNIFPAYDFAEAEKVVALPKDSMLLSIINKSIRSLTSDEINDVVINNTIGKSYHASFYEIIYKYRHSLIGIALLLLAIFILAMSMLFIKQRNYRAMAKVKEKLEVSNEQLEDAVRQADRANSAKSQFLARMSHEIRTPMNAIVGLTAIARSHLDNADQMKDYLGKIDTSSHVLLSIINDVLDMSAIESKKMKISENDFDLKQVLTGISSIYYTQCRNKGINFELGADLKQEVLVGDSLRINQILLNLVSNAFKFTRPGGKIEINAKEIEHRDNMVYIRFTVSDTGCGMGKDMLERIFKPFEQETSQTAQEHGGSGLGLSIAKNLVELMNGAIRVESEKGKGTTFFVDIPFKVSPKSTEAYGKVRKLRALVVDDDATAQEYTGIILDRIGVPYTVATSGEQALELLSAAHLAGEKYDVCFVDWKMPKMNGIDLTKKIREKNNSETLIIIVSAYDVGEVEEEARAAGADLFVSKPLFQSTVFNLLMRLSGGSYRNETGNPDEYDFTGHKILLVEDNELNRDIALALLELVHMNADCAVDGQDAVKRFEKSQPGEYELILMDIQMPNMNGYEATKAIRASSHPEANIIPIVAMTANAFSSDISQALSVGMNAHLAKPIDTKLLYRTLAKYIRKSA